MNQFRGLVTKDWTIIKGYVLLALLLDIIVPLASVTLFPLESFEERIVVAGTFMAMHMFLPLVLLSILFSKELERPDIYFHSSASIHKINASKLCTVIFSTAISLFWISVLAFAFLLFTPDVTDVTNLFVFGVVFAVGILFFSVQIAIIYYFYMALFYTMKPKIGGFAYIVTFGLFIFGLEMWDRFKATDFFTTVTDFWIVPLNESEFLTNIAHGLMVPFETPATLQIGQFAVITMLLAFLYLVSAYWFEKKVRA